MRDKKNFLPKRYQKCVIKKLKSNNRTGRKLFAIEIASFRLVSDQFNALYTSGNVRSRYKIIALGHYPQNVKYTQKSRSAIQYQIPDGYIVKTEAASKNVRCEMKYIPINKVLYTITWKEGRAEYSISSERSASGAINAFLKRIDRENSRLSGIHVFGFDIEILHQARIGKLSIEKPIIIDKRKRLLNEVQSVSQQNKRFASFGRDAHNKIKQLILQYRMLSESGDPVHLHNMELEYEDHIINIKYNLSLDHTKLDAYVHACDEALLGDTINLKLGGDGRNVGKEKYETLAKVGHLFKYQLQDLQENGIHDNNGVHWPVELFFSGDWKFMYNIMGLNAPNSKYFCLYCDCEASQKKPSLFPTIKQENFIPDELHLLLRISDILMECFFNDLFKKKEFEREIKNQIEHTVP
ncbi:hypothetical protein C1645_835303 [Glomus cerebriforme]|uniref:Uncharacterized protein n=1 Tax=Glomus cerebriforme TaxID=658196 RepID=A0A397SER4_9GLOM|nr:hypothetical protein C1645_835303 [Glomus cerebriforme]